MRLNDKGAINYFKITAKTHVTMDEKTAIPLYAEHLHSLLTRCGWKVTKVRGYYTFEQIEFNKDFVIMNQVSNQNAKTDVEKDFFKLMNNVSFGYDCRNNADNSYFSQIYDELEELMYAKRYQNISDQSISECISSEYLEIQTEERFSNNIARLDPNDEYYDARKKYLEIEKRKELDAVCSMKKSRQKKHKKMQ